MGDPASLFVIGLPRSGSGEAYARATSALGLRRPSWTSDGEILNLDRYATHLGARHDEGAKFTRPNSDPALFASVTELLATAVRRRGFAYKDVVQPFVVSQWEGIRELRVLHVRRDVAEVACAMLKRRWLYPAAVPSSNGPSGHDPLAPLAALVAGLIEAERALESVPAVRIEFEELILDAGTLNSALEELYPSVEQRAIPLHTAAEIAASRSHLQELRRAPDYAVLRGLVDRARGRGSGRRERPERRPPARARGLSQRGLKVVVAFPGWMELPPQQPECSFTTDLRELPSADAVVFHIPTTPIPIPIDKVDGQRWIAWSFESEANYPQLTDAAFMEQFDLTMTYRRDADVVVAYCGPEDWLPFSPPPQPASREPVPAVYFASNLRDRSGRTAYVRELMRHMPVDSYGRALNNRALIDDRGAETKLTTISRYRFTLAFENSIAPGYVTEKFYEPLLVGSVPVYLGAPDIAEHSPAADCYIDVGDFADPSALAEYLLALSADETRYARYFEWHRRELDRRFLTLVEEQRTPAICRLCRLLRESNS